MLVFEKLKNIVRGKDDEIDYFMEVFFINTEILEVEKGLSEQEAREQFIKDLAKETSLNENEISQFLEREFKNER